MTINLQFLGLFTDIVGVFLLGLGIISSRAGEIAWNTGAYYSINADLSFQRLKERNDAIFGTILILIGFALQLLSLGVEMEVGVIPIIAVFSLVMIYVFLVRKPFALYQLEKSVGEFADKVLQRDNNAKQLERFKLVFENKFIHDRFIPIGTVVLAIILLWYALTVVLNAPFERDQAERAGTEISTSELISNTMSQKRPVLPAPHQVGVEIWKTTVEKKITSKRSLIYHGWVTLSSTMLGFALGTGLGILLAVGIVHSRVLDKSLMPWIITSQTIPILAIAPMVIVVLNAVGISGLLPKAIISMYLSFFPVAVGMVKGLRSPEVMHLDLMHTYNASRAQVFWKLRWPASVPFLFTSMKVAVAISLVGAIVGELPTGASAGLGARLLTGSYYGQTIQIWSALISAAVLAAILVMIIDLIGRSVTRRMGVVS